MPAQEVSSAVDGQSVIDMHSNEVIVSSLRTNIQGRIKSWRFGHQTQNCIGVCNSILGAEMIPDFVSLVHREITLDLPVLSDNDII